MKINIAFFIVVCACMFLMSKPVEAVAIVDTNTYVYFVTNIYTDNACATSPAVQNAISYFGECFPQSSGELKWTGADGSGVTMCSYVTPTAKNGCDPAFQKECSKISYGSCVPLPAQSGVLYVKFLRVFINPEASPPTHYTVMDWSSTPCSSAPAGKLPGRVPAPNLRGVYPRRLLMNITDRSGKNPPEGSCETAFCGSTPCWVWKTSSTGNLPPSANICSNGLIDFGGTSCGAATFCNSFVLDGTTCVRPTYQPFVSVGNEARFDVVLPNTNNAAPATTAAATTAITVAATTGSSDSGVSGAAGQMKPFHYGLIICLLVLVVTI